MSEWKPISTAPKDGTKVDLWVVERFIREPSKNASERVTDAWWGVERHPQGWGYEGEGECWVYSAEFVHDERVERNLSGGARFATHWMPLPEPPKE